MNVVGHELTSSEPPTCVARSTILAVTWWRDVSPTPRAAMSAKA
jgi:hypothetical protein